MLCVTAAQAQDVEPAAAEAASAPAPAPAAAPEMDQVIYKGLVGNLLEAVPIDPEQRVQLQRTNAVVSNIASARSLTVLLGLTNPLLMIGGLVWGIWSASQIKPPQMAARALDSLCVDNGVGEAESVSLVMN